jgi:phosphate transport system protein
MTRTIDPVLHSLREQLLRMGSRAEAILSKAVRSYFDGNERLANEVAEDDLEIDRLDLEIDDRVLKALALQAPVASDLRAIVAVKMIATDLERVGDLARNIAKGALRRARRPAAPVPPGLAQLAADVQRILRRALDAFSQGDAAAARAVLGDDDRIDSEEGEFIASAIGAIPGRPDHASEAVDAILIAKHLERVGDHATNIAEDVILVAEARNVKHAAKLAR